MSLIFRISNRDLPCKDYKITLRQNSVGEFSAVVPRIYIQDFTDLYFRDTAIIKDGVQLISGIAYDENVTVDEDGYIWSEILCFDELGRLMNEPAFVNPRNSALGHFQDKQLIGIFILLLAGTTQWQIGNFSTLTSALVEMTIDLRDTETRWAQLVRLASRVENCFLRYGGIDAGTGRHRIDVGAFGQKYGNQVEDGTRIFSIQRKRSRFERVREYVSVGGVVLGGEPITLDDALNFDPTLATHPNYPIVSIPALYSALAVRNNALAVGATRRKDFPDIRTRNDVAPTLAERNAAGYSLWQAVVAQLQKHTAVTTYEVEGDFSAPPRIGDLLQIHGNAKQVIIDPVTLQTSEVNTFNVSGEFYIHQMEISSRNEIDNYNLICGTSRYANDGDNEVDVYEAADELGGIGAVLATVNYDISGGSQSQGPGVASNCNQYVVGVGNVNGRSFTVALPVPPGGAVAVTFAVATSNPNAIVTTTTVPALPATGWTGCVSINNNWTLTDSMTVTVVFVYT